MKCKSCQTYYVRDPCPNCGHDSSKKVNRNQEQDESNTTVKPSQIRQREKNTGSQVLMQKEDEEKLVKPSERFKQENRQTSTPTFKRFAKPEEEERLVKPSERMRKEQERDEDLPSFKRFDRSQPDVRSKPSKINNKRVQDEDEIPSFARYQQEEEVDVKNLSRLNKPDQEDRLKNDVAYRKKVKETLEEVMGLLEKLVEDE